KRSFDSAVRTSSLQYSTLSSFSVIAQAIALFVTKVSSLQYLFKGTECPHSLSDGTGEKITLPAPSAACF
ncbi:MAG: hypothetical protein ACLQVY_07260, partial [Limisphaerales bacterium]